MTTDNDASAPRCSCGRHFWRFGYWVDDLMPTCQRPQGWCSDCGEWMTVGGQHLPTNKRDKGSGDDDAE
jgi:hypothetical protein